MSKSDQKIHISKIHGYLVSRSVLATTSLVRAVFSNFLLLKVKGARRVREHGEGETLRVVRVGVVETQGEGVTRMELFWQLKRTRSMATALFF